MYRVAKELGDQKQTVKTNLRIKQMDGVKDYEKNAVPGRWKAYTEELYEADMKPYELDMGMI